MSENLVQELPEASRLALASAGQNRDLWLAVFALDARIGSYVLGAQEPLLAQMRIAWWRDELRKEPAARPQGDQLLDLIGATWDGQTEGLQYLLDGWEALLAEAPLGKDAISVFVEGREQLAGFLCDRLATERNRAPAVNAARDWALADLAYRLPDETDRALALAMARESARPAAPPRALQPLAVLAGLSRRALARGGAPLIGDRLSPLVALRLGLFGR